jgi:hypothetical protein
MSVRDHFVLAYAEHLHSDPTLFEIELEYMGRCGAGRERIATVIGHIPVVPPPVSLIMQDFLYASHTNNPLGRPNGLCQTPPSAQVIRGR